MLHELFILIYFKFYAERMDNSISADSNKLCDVAQTSFSYPVNGIPSQGHVGDLSELMTRTISEQFKKSNDENKSFMLEVIHKNKSDIDEKFEMLNNKYARIEKE